MTICSEKRPWGIHQAARLDSECPRCGWTAPGPIGDTRAAAAEDALMRAQGLGWTVIEGGEALAA